MHALLTQNASESHWNSIVVTLIVIVITYSLTDDMVSTVLSVLVISVLVPNPSHF